ncbi:MAG: hypothetical protein AAGF11_03615 [Myxococcota bacterium]
MSSQRGEYHFMPPHKGRLKVIGMVDAEQLSGVWGAALASAEGLPFFLLEADISEMDGQSPDARRATIKYFHSLPPFAIAVVAKTFAQRAIGKLVIKASRLLATDQGNLEASDFFKNSEQANEWLDSQVDMLKAKAGVD